MGKEISAYTRLALASLVLLLVVGLQPVRVDAAVPDEIEASVMTGTSWLVAQQNADGSWGSADRTASTCLALTHLQARAHDLGYASPFDPRYEYSAQVELAWDYVLDHASSHVLARQDHRSAASGMVDDPDANGNGYGIYFQPGYHEVYATGVCAMALGSSGTPGRPNDLGLDINSDGSPDTFLDIAQDVVDWLAFAQVDLGNGEGGWEYRAVDNAGSAVAGGANSTYAVFGLAQGQEFGCTVPDWVRTELRTWIEAVQDPVDGDTNDGGAWYRPGWRWVNQLNTASLMSGIAFAGDGPESQSFKDALRYVESHWRDADLNPGWGYAQYPSDYQAMYWLQKGLTDGGVSLVDMDGDGTRDDVWLNRELTALSARNVPDDLVGTIVTQQGANGAWPDSCRNGDAVRCTAWALLTLSQVTSEQPTQAAAQPELWPVEYRWGAPEPGYSVANWPIFESWTHVRIENRGSGDAFDVTAKVIRGLANTTVPDPHVTVGDVSAGHSVWSDDTFTTQVDMANPVDPCKGGLWWRIEYYDEAGVRRVSDDVPQFPLGECPCER